MAIRIGANPIGWSNDDLIEIGGATPLQTCLAEAREAGIEGMELGNKFPREPEALKAALEPYGMACIGGWHSIELLFRTVQDVMLKLDAVRSHLTDSREKPHGDLRITTTFALGTSWLSPRLGEFLDLYPDIKLQVILTDEELDLGMREADIGLRLREPTQPDLIRRRLFTVHYHAYASPAYLKRHGQPKSIDDLGKHRLIGYSGSPSNYLVSLLNSLQAAGRDAKSLRPSTVTINNMVASFEAVQSGAGIGVLPDYLAGADGDLVQVLPNVDMPELDCYFVYPEELKSVARVQVLRDFLVANAQRWRF